MTQRRSIALVCAVALARVVKASEDAPVMPKDDEAAAAMATGSETDESVRTFFPPLVPPLFPPMAVEYGGAGGSSAAAAAAAAAADNALYPMPYYGGVYQQPYYGGVYQQPYYGGGGGSGSSSAAAAASAAGYGFYPAPYYGGGYQLPYYYGGGYQQPYYQGGGYQQPYYGDGVGTGGAGAGSSSSSSSSSSTSRETIINGIGFAPPFTPVPDPCANVRGFYSYQCRVTHNAAAASAADSSAGAGQVGFQGPGPYYAASARPSYLPWIRSMAAEPAPEGDGK